MQTSNGSALSGSDAGPSWIWQTKCPPAGGDPKLNVAELLPTVPLTAAVSGGVPAVPTPVAQAASLTTLTLSTNAAES